MQNVITVIPGSFTIQNFIPGKIYKDAIVIYNTCNVPITIKLTSSDKNKLLLNENIIRLGVNQTKKINIIIQDKVKYNYNKFPFQKKLFIHLKGDLIDEKFEINLYYFVKGGYNPVNNLNDIKNIQRQFDNLNSNNNNTNYEFNNTNNNNNDNNNNVDEDYLRSMKFLDNINNNNNNNNNYNNSNNIYNNSNYNNNYNNNNNNNNNYNITNEDEYNIPISINKVEEFSILSHLNNNEIDLNLNENLSNEEKISELKNTIKILFNKLNTMNKLLIEYENKITETNKIFSLNSKDYNKEQISLFFISESSFMKNLNKIEPEIDIKNIKVQNELLTTENKILNQRIKDLEDKLMYITGENIDNNNNDNNDNNNIDNNNIDNNMNNNYYNNSNGAENINNNELHDINEEDDNNNIESDNINNINSDNNNKEENPLTYSNSNKLNSSENEENNYINNNNNDINIVDNNKNNNYDNNENENNNMYINYNIDNNNINNNNHEIIESNNLNIDPELIDNINNENENENL